MDRKIKRVELGFENVEMASIPGECIGQMIVDGSDKTGGEHKTHTTGNHLKPGEILLVLEPQARYLAMGLSSGTDVFERIKLYDDITEIIVFYQDGTEEYLQVDWFDKESDCNVYQTSGKIEDRMHVVFSRTKRFMDVWGEQIQ